MASTQDPALPYLKRQSGFWHYLRSLASDKKYLGWKLLTLSGRLKRFCLFCIFNKWSGRISFKLAHPPFCLAHWFWSLIWGRLLAWWKPTSMIKRLIYMPPRFWCSSLLWMPNTFHLQLYFSPSLLANEEGENNEEQEQRARPARDSNCY